MNTCKDYFVVVEPFRPSLVRHGTGLKILTAQLRAGDKKFSIRLLSCPTYKKV